MITHLRPHWDDRKEKSKKYLRYNEYEDELELKLITMFEYENLPGRELNEYIETLANRDGKGVIWECDGMYIATPFAFTGELMADGYLKDITATSYNGKTKVFKNWRENKECVVFFNNSTHSPDLSIGRTAAMLANIDLSEEMLVLYSRLKPLLIANTEEMKKALDLALNDIKDGKITTFVKSEILAQYLGDEKAIETVNITDVTASQWLQYVSAFRKDVFARWHFDNGFNLNMSEKRAQMNTGEITQNDDATFIIPVDKLKQRLIMIDECNEKFGWDAVVNFSHCWLHEHGEDKTVDEETDEIDDEEDVEDTNIEHETDVEDKENEES